MVQSPCRFPLLPFLIPFTYLETLLAVTGSGYISTTHQSLLHGTLTQLYILMDRMEPLIIGLPQPRTSIVLVSRLMSMCRQLRQLLLGVNSGELVRGNHLSHVNSQPAAETLCKLVTGLSKDGGLTSMCVCGGGGEERLLSRGFYKILYKKSTTNVGMQGPLPLTD